MGRQVMRVPLDFDWPLGVAWFGHELPSVECQLCDGTGYKATTSEGTEPKRCDLCNGGGDVYVGFDLPEGDGWQMWETDSGTGSAMSPVFATPEGLAKWLADTGASACGFQTATYEQWLAVITGPGHACSMVITSDGSQFGVAFEGDRLMAEKAAGDLLGQPAGQATP